MALSVNAQSGNVSALNKKQFDKYWRVESEAADYSVSFRGDTAEIVSPKGLTLWRREMMKGRVTVEYDACVVVERDGDRLSDLNCFWMASDPQRTDIWQRAAWRQGIFLNCYSLQLYYMGYGGNHNSTTRFRRYDGNEEGISNADKRPAILKEYTDEAHLLKANHWYHVKITNDGNRVCYYIDGERLVDFRDAEPLTEGWFGFRTTLSRTRITNFRYSMDDGDAAAVCVPLRWIGSTPASNRPAAFGIPFREGEVKADDRLQLTTAAGERVAVDTWPLAYWPDGSVKWGAVAGVIPANSDSLCITKATGSAKKSGRKSQAGITVSESDGCIRVATGVMTAYIPRSGEAIIDSLVHGDVRVAGRGRLVCSTQSQPAAESVDQLTFKRYTSRVKSATVERAGDVRALVKIEGVHAAADGREWLPFTVRLYFYAGSDRIKMVHNFIYDGNQNSDFIRSLGVRFDVPMREALYNRHVAFACADGGVWSESVQPLSGRRPLVAADAGDGAAVNYERMQVSGERVPERSAFNEAGQTLLTEWASWDGYRLSQLSADGFTIRKRANDNNPWIGTHSGQRADGYAFAGDISGGLGVAIEDFWQSYPSSIEISGAKTPTAEVTAWLWSPEAEPMDLRHYDNVAHGLNASYEDVQEGMSTPYGIGRTTTLTIVPQGGYAGKADFARRAASVTEKCVLMSTPEYMHRCRAFGVWSLPDRSTEKRARVEQRLDDYISLYKNMIEQNRWYGFWNYGDVMHAYDPVRHEWMYDVGGYAWDNTELASNMWLWYDFLRTGHADIWRMAEAMARHTSEVDVYHMGPNAGLGSRHNVSHWGCGAKEARISQAAWNRFYYYLTTDERSGDLMSAVTDADQKLYEIDPMRLAQPRSQYPCTAPARLRIGPDWLAYAGNWMTEWERTGNTVYRDKIMAGMKSIVALPNKIFTGPKALGYDPATGIITTECDPKLEATNHLMTIMGGFEVMNELMPMMNYREWNDAWLDHAARYKQKALEISKNRFRVARLMAYAAYYNRDSRLANEAWTDLFGRLEHTPAPEFRIEQVLPPEVPAPIDECATISTNDAALWSLDAIYMQEVIPQ
jgi:hypothetical protein